MKNKIIIGAVSIAMCTPVLADIAKNASTATCDSSTIGATNGTAYMDTDWTANTINLDFYSDGEKISTGTCTYDGAIELPEDPEDKTGYTFGGWQLRRAPTAQSGFNLSTLASSISTNGSAYAYIRNSGQSSKANSSGTRKAPDAYSLTTAGEWATEFGYGTVKGIALCASNNGGTYAVVGTPEGTSGRNCWCQASGFDAEKDGTYLNVSSSSWVFSRDFDNADDCAYNCALDCATRVRGDYVLRRAVFGISE